VRLIAAAGLVILPLLALAEVAGDLLSGGAISAAFPGPWLKRRSTRSNW
jgi:hypothetical protein